MRDRSRWVIVLVLALVIGGLVATARGRAHHRGDEVGASADPTAAVAASES
jgi:hypothetical protein